MYCQNCGAGNEEGAKFCANCGTTLGAAAPAAGEPNAAVHQQAPQQEPSSYTPSVQQPPVYSAAPGYQTRGGGFGGGGNSTLKNIGIGCLIAIAIFFFVGISCTRACFGLRRSHIIRRY